MSDLVDIMQLSNNQGVRGQLKDVIEPDGEDITLAYVESFTVEVPRALSSKLWSLMQQNIVLAHIAGQFRAEAST